MNKLARDFTASFETPTDAIYFLSNHGGGVMYTLSRLGQWRNGKLPIPLRVRVAMLLRVLEPHLEREFNLNPSDRDCLKEKIMDWMA